VAQGTLTSACGRPPFGNAADPASCALKRGKERDCSAVELATAISTTPLILAPLCVQFWNGVVVK
jgi:hypothetical protein